MSKAVMVSWHVSAVGYFHGKKPGEAQTNNDKKKRCAEDMQWHKTPIAIVSVIRQRCLQSLQVCQVHSSGKLVTSAIQIRKKKCSEEHFLLTKCACWWVPVMRLEAWWRIFSFVGLLAEKGRNPCYHCGWATVSFANLVAQKLGSWGRVVQYFMLVC